MSERGMAETEADVGLTGGLFGPKPGRDLYAALFLASLGLLTLEVSLTRLFSFTVWYHMAYLTISVAILGFGASGAIVAAFPGPFRHHGRGLLAALLVAAAVATLLSLAYLIRVPLEVLDLQLALRAGEFPTRFSWMLFSYYAAVGAPFLLAGFAIAVPFAAYPEHMGRLYFADLLGAALGCLSVVAFITLFGAPGLVAAAAGMMLLAAAALAVPEWRQGGVGLAAAGLLVVAAAAILGVRLPVETAPTKASPHRKAAMERGDIYTRWTALNRVDMWGWEKPNRAALWLRVGVSTGFDGVKPATARFQHDGSNGSSIWPWDGSFDRFGFLKGHVISTAYELSERPRVLAIGVGGGIDLFNAIYHGARHVTGVEVQPEVVRILKGRMSGFNGGFFLRDDVRLVASEGRHYVRRSDETFDHIQITAVDTFAAQASGAYVMSESYLYTVEVQVDFLSHLEADGVLAMVVGDILFEGALPPLATRAALNGLRALEQLGEAHPEDHLAIVTASSVGGRAHAANVLVKRSPFTAAEIARLRDYADENGFALLHAPARLAGPDQPLAVVLGGDEAARAALLDESWFRLDAVYDSDPFFFNVAKWRNFSPNMSQDFIYPGSFIGQVVLVLMALQALAFGVIVVVFPLFWGAREGLRARGVPGYLAYFLALGVGFMFVEISFIQSFVLFLGSPTYALSITIFSLLLFSAVGSLLSTRFADRATRLLPRLVVGLALLVVLYVVGLASVFHAFLGLPLGFRIAIAMAAQMPMGLLLGMFMPLGIGLLSQDSPRLVPWAWGINGVGSVLGTTGAVMIAMAWGFPAVAGIAALLYVIGTAGLLASHRSARLSAAPSR